MSLWVETDGEPDDCLALLALKKKYNKIDVLVVSEGKAPHLKAARLKRMLGDFVEHIVLGATSDKDFPEEESGKVHSDVTYEEMLEKTHPDTIIIMCPPRKLIQMWKEKHDAAALFMWTATCYMYGSFNIRCLLKKHATEEITQFLTDFGTLYYYENYAAVGEENVANESVVSRELMDTIVALPGMGDIMRRWDEWNVKDCVDTIEELKQKKGPMSEADEAKLFRNIKCRDQIMEHQGRQFVLADIGLVLAEKNDWVPTHLVVDEKTGYMKCEKPVDSCVQFCMKKIGREAVLGRLGAVFG